VFNIPLDTLQVI